MQGEDFISFLKNMYILYLMTQKRATKFKPKEDSTKYQKGGLAASQ